MKKMKILFGVFVLSILVSVSGASADTHMSFVGLKLAAWSGVYTSSQADKTIDDYQYILTSGARDNLSGDTRAISARTLDTEDGVYTNWIAANIGERNDWGENTNMFVGKYKLNLKATKSTLSTVTYNGTWYLDSRLVK